jgi:hypothetical protein
MLYAIGFGTAVTKNLKRKSIMYMWCKKMKKNHVFWIVAITAILSFFHAVGTLLTYSEIPFIHDLGNFFFNNLLFRVWQIAAFLIAGYFLIKKLPAYIVVIPIIFAFMGLPFVLFTVDVLPLGADVGNPIEMVIHLGLFVYSVAVLAKTKE